MKTRLLTLLLCMCVINTKAQYVTIPDANFVAWLNNNGYSQCMNGNQMDTTCSAVVSATEISCGSSNISSLDGVQYFDVLETLNCQNNDLTTLPQLATSIKYLRFTNNSINSIQSFPPNVLVIQCENNGIITLPSLPLQLRVLICYGNNLQSIPTLPSTLVSLDCSGNSINALPSLPSTLRKLECSHNILTLLPALPAMLEELQFDYNNISVVPNLPDSLQLLTCSANGIQTLPTLPSTLIYLAVGGNNLSSLQIPPLLETLRCGNNNLSQLPTLPSSLSDLDCSDNNISVLPSLPTGLDYLDCGHNPITQIPQLPPPLGTLKCNSTLISSIPTLSVLMQNLECHDNPNLYCLPKLTRLYSFKFYNTGITCLPNHIEVVYQSIPLVDTVPLCLGPDANINGCNAYWNIKGRTHFDTDSSCLHSLYEVGRENVKHSLLKDGNIVSQIFTDIAGVYSFEMNDTGNYEVRIDTTGLPFSLFCPASGSYYDTITTTDSIFAHNDFALTCKQGFDLAARSISTPTAFRPANNTIVNILAGDLSNFYNAHCAVGVAGTLTVTLNGAAAYIAPASGALTPSNVTGNVITWNVADFGTVNGMTDFSIIVHTDTFAQLGNSICFTAHISPTVGDNDSSNNTLTHCFTIVNSYDPNDKQVYPAARIDTAQEWLTYTVRFQNTGTAEAQHIYVMDTLDSEIDASTFQLLAYSHQPNIQINERIVRFNFPNISLPDSNTNEPASHGYVQYKVKLKESLPLGTVISNTAYIYFDFNPPVVTNTVTNTISEEADTVVIGIKEAVKAFVVSLYPNPANSTVWIIADEAGCELKLYNLQGELLKAERMTDTNHNISIIDLPSGIYTMDIAGKSSRARKKLVKL